MGGNGARNRRFGSVCCAVRALLALPASSWGSHVVRSSRDEGMHAPQMGEMVSV